MQKIKMKKYRESYIEQYRVDSTNRTTDSEK